MKKLTKKQFKKMLLNPKFISIDDDNEFKNLTKGYWVYDELLCCLKKNGWVRFAPGFKGGVYGNEKSDYCIKLLGMGVGDAPAYFCEKGEYIWHERNMMKDFRDNGFSFLPNVLSTDESIEFLIKECGINKEQAYLRCKNNDLLITEYIKGIPFAIQTGFCLDYKLNIEDLEREVVIEMIESLFDLKKKLKTANNQGFLHNDPMPPNILFTFEGNTIVAKLVDFELAQNLNKESPAYVNNSVAELYNEREVPFNNVTKKYTKNLDQHLLDGSINVLRQLLSIITLIDSNKSIWDGVSISIPVIGGPSVTIGAIINAATK